MNLTVLVLKFGPNEGILWLKKEIQTIHKQTILFRFPNKLLELTEVVQSKLNRWCKPWVFICGLQGLDLG